MDEFLRASGKPAGGRSGLGWVLAIGAVLGLIILLAVAGGGTAPDTASPDSGAAPAEPAADPAPVQTD